MIKSSLHTYSCPTSSKNTPTCCRSRLVYAVVVTWCFIQSHNRRRMFRDYFAELTPSPSVSVTRHGRTRVIIWRLYCTTYTHNMAATTLNMHSTYSNCVIVKAYKSRTFLRYSITYHFIISCFCDVTMQNQRIAVYATSLTALDYRT